MRQFPRSFVITAGLLLLVTAHAIAAPPQDPLRFIPDKTDLILKIEQPRQLAEKFAKLDAIKQAEKLDVVRGFLDSPQARRVFEFIAYYERDLGAKWPELLDKLAGGGIAIGAKIADGNNDPVLGVIQGTDEALMKKFVERIAHVLDQELIRSESKDRVTKNSYKDFETLHLSKDLHACRIDAALLVSNNLDALRKGIDQHIENISKDGKPSKNILNSATFNKAKKLLPENPQVWLYYALDYLKSRPEAKNVLTSPRDNTILTFAFAGYLDAARRADFITAGLFENKDGFTISIRMPAGRDGMAEDAELHLPRDLKKPGTLPLLEPKGVIFSHSFYLDLGAFWEKRDKMMSVQNAKEFADNIKNAGRFLPGTSFEKLFLQSGVHWRLVAANREKSSYSIEPKLRLPAFAGALSMRDPAFGKSMEALIRGGAFLASTQVTLKLFEEKYGEIPILGYRFPEDGKFADDEQNLRFNFVPTFAAVRDQYIFATSLELCKELIDIIQKEDRSKLITQNMQMRLFADGASYYLNASPEQLLTQTILGQAVPEAEAKKQIEQLLKYLRQLGSVKIETDYTAKDFRFDIQWKIGK